MNKERVYTGLLACALAWIAAYIGTSAGHPIRALIVFVPLIVFGTYKLFTSDDTDY